MQTSDFLVAVLFAAATQQLKIWRTHYNNLISVPNTCKIFHFILLGFFSDQAESCWNTQRQNQSTARM